MARIVLSLNDFRALAGGISSGVRRATHVNGAEQITFNDGTCLARRTIRDPAERTAHRSEFRQAPDGRAALRLPQEYDDLEKGACTWLLVIPPTSETHLCVALLTDDDVADWTPLVPGGA